MIVDRVVAHKTHKWQVRREVTCKDQSGATKRPDLVFSDLEHTVVIDTTVRFESGRSLDKAYAEKVSKYQTCAESLKAITGTETIEFHGLVIGARGAWCVENAKPLAALGIDCKSFRSQLCNKALLKTLDLLYLFGNR